MKDKEFLQWILGRLVEVHGENPNYDYMHKLRAIIAATHPGQHTANICSDYEPLNLSLIEPEHAFFYKVEVNRLNYEVPKEVAEQFAKFNRRAVIANAEIKDGLDAIDELEKELREQARG